MELYRGAVIVLPMIVRSKRSRKRKEGEKARARYALAEETNYLNVRAWTGMFIIWTRTLA